MFKLETKRLLLRELTIDDFNDLYEILSDAETMKHYPAPFTKEKTKSWINWNIDNYKKYGFGLWALIIKEENKFIGDCGITMQMIEKEEVHELGYHINKMYWNNGYATEAAMRCKQYAFEDLKIDRIFSYMEFNNKQSVKIAKKIGMTFIKYWDRNSIKEQLWGITKE